MLSIRSCTVRSEAYMPAATKPQYLLSNIHIACVCYAQVNCVPLHCYQVIALPCTCRQVWKAWQHTASSFLHPSHGQAHPAARIATAKCGQTLLDSGSTVTVLCCTTAAHIAGPAFHAVVAATAVAAAATILSEVSICCCCCWQYQQLFTCLFVLIPQLLSLLGRSCYGCSLPL